MTKEEAIQKIKEMFEADQAIQKVDLEKAKELAASHVKVIKGIINQFGWPTISEFGQDTAYRTWNIVQHADTDVHFQQKCLDLMRELLPEEVERVNIAYLTDRVLTNLNKEQIYGTQMEDKGEYLTLKPTEDLEKLDERRVYMGLNPIREYFKFFSKPAYLTEQEKLVTSTI